MGVADDPRELLIVPLDLEIVASHNNFLVLKKVKMDLL